MEDQTLNVIISGGCAIIVTTLSVWLKWYLDGKKRRNELENLISENDFKGMVIIQEWLDKVRIEDELDRIAIYQFHNGGYFTNGKSMKKFSMTYESTRSGLANMKRNSQNILVSENPRWIEKMFHDDFFVTEKPVDDPKAKEEFERWGIQQSITIPIKDIRKKMIGFVVIHYIMDTDSKIVNKKDYYLHKISEIAGYLSQTQTT